VLTLLLCCLACVSAAVVVGRDEEGRVCLLTWRKSQGDSRREKGASTEEKEEREDCVCVLSV
jgi:hypothetical protein